MPFDRTVANRFTLPRRVYVQTGVRRGGSDLDTVKRRLELLYEGRSRIALLFRICLLGFDVLTIGLFLVLTFVDENAPGSCMWIWSWPHS